MVFTRNYGGNAFLGYGLGYTYGFIIASIASWGWGLVGAASVAPATEKRRFEYLLCFYKSTAVLVLSLLPFFVIVLWLTCTPDERGIALLSFFATVIATFVPKWWFYAADLPNYLMYYLVIPKALANLISALWIQFGNGPAVSFPGLLLLFTFGGFLLFTIKYKIWTYNSELKPMETIKRQFPAFINSVGYTLNNKVLLPIVTVISTTAAVAFNLGNQLYGYWTIPATIMVSAFQNYVNREGKKSLESSLKFTTVWFAGTGLILGIILWLLGPWVSKVAFGGTYGNSSLSYLIIGITFLCYSLNSAFVALYLAPLGFTNITSKITILSLFTGLLTIYPLVKLFGTNGAYMAFCITETVITLGAIIVIYQHRRRGLESGIKHLS
ncbi:MAG: hypothetical protein QM613_04015 [Micrococcaceae bacterium]